MVTVEMNEKPSDVEVPLDRPMPSVSRGVIGLTRTRFGRGIAERGACTIHLDGQSIRSCVTAHPIQEY